MSSILFVCLSLFAPLDLENAGSLAEAGAAWAEQGNQAGQVRVAGRLLEEALYAGHVDRALLLITELEPFSADSSMTDFWMARAAWSCGFSAEAVAGLAAVSEKAGSNWLKYRSLGLSELFAGKGAEAVEHLLLSVEYGTTAREKFWSALDLCSAYLNIGDSSSALMLSGLLVEQYPSDALAPVMYGLCLHISGRYSESFRVLGAINSSSSAAADIADALMKGFEQ
ncbi:hypothetical protein CSA37_04875 [Candidatus Fermentibacteria bacterium]|nr:MAG: hypothetical protein CSA37_10165 [Candidatus Fermentibacteria bacterium]PIE52262.1 MAG: hypothetical protein CSA37_07270 [Candidatus Fermentibacteria bacterium]PIE52757.1 MAG: hypothetical protein CSA37_04875 [Candidatus Fermentibacteria bacterium]